MADLSPVETLRAAATLLQADSARWIEFVHPWIARELAGWLGDTAADFETDGVDEPMSSSESYALAVARVLLGVPDGQ